MEIQDIPSEPAPITDPSFVILIDDAEAKIAKNQLCPTDVESRLAASTIFMDDNVFDWNDDDDGDDDEKRLPENVIVNISAFKRAIQQGSLYIAPHTSYNMIQLGLNTILMSMIRDKASELHLVATSVVTFLSPIFSVHDPIYAAVQATYVGIRISGLHNTRSTVVSDDTAETKDRK
ncbi:hypothetical protein MBANPS3_011085 [Mucor bainieri]